MFVSVVWTLAFSTAVELPVYSVLPVLCCRYFREPHHKIESRVDSKLFCFQYYFSFKVFDEKVNSPCS